MKFRKEKISHLLGHTEVQFTEESTLSEHQPFRVCATPRGVYLQGTSPMLRDALDMDTFARVVGDAAKEYVKLKPRIVGVDEGGII